MAWERGYARSSRVPREGVWPGNEATLEGMGMLKLCQPYSPMPIPKTFKLRL